MLVCRRSHFVSRPGRQADIAASFCRQSREERKKDVAKVFCVTFGAPLVADAAVVELVKDRLWTQDFLHIVSRHDLVPRILIAKMQGASSFCGHA